MSSNDVIKALRGVRFRLTLVYSTLFGLFICVFAYVISSHSIKISRSVFDSALLNYAIDVANPLERSSLPFKGELRVPLREHQKEFPFTLQETSYVVRSAAGDFLTQGGKSTQLGTTIPYDPSLATAPDYSHTFLSHKTKTNEYRVVNIKITSGSGLPLILQVASPMDALLQEEQRAFLTNLIVIPLLIIFSSILSYIIAGNALGPIRSLIKTANSIAASNLSLRVPEVDTGDEIFELSKTFNTLLERLEKSFKAQENFVANASHQLNTPLAIIKGELDVLESKDRSLEDHERFRKSLREELERLIGLVQQMLLVSRVEAGQESFHFLPVRLDEVLLTTSSRLSTRAREKKITIRFNLPESLDEESMIINGERQLLSCLFENILENAIKYSPAETVVRINIDLYDEGPIVEISDEGPGIGSNDLQGLLSQRFQRGSKILPGTGIGLAIASQIADYHGARIEYERGPSKGSLFKVVFVRKLNTALKTAGI